ncbi:hypothetical protein EVAR_11117_1 [Eumeta japonica]|uniref:Uncharacterized protein n=1 Tax=Eumeta variegata TaxID=151549 RepID=A0A4C1U5G2_EUMVA|nr:hypothetical protein EVAR_11117_1 [Eumeta japonica]
MCGASKTERVCRNSSTLDLDEESFSPSAFDEHRRGLVFNQCFVCAVGTTTTHLTVVRVNGDPAPVKDHQVPVFLYSQESFVPDQWDLTTNQVSLAQLSLGPRLPQSGRRRRPRPTSCRCICAVYELSL